jgi:succinyl-CoA synthetase beta subunit
MILAEIEAENLLEKEGFPVAKKVVIDDKKQLSDAAKKMGFPCVMKISSPNALHKAAIGGVRIIYNSAELESSWEKFRMSSEKVNGKIILQKFVSGKEILVGLKKDPVFGHVLLVGIGGSLTEIIKDINFRILNDIDAPKALEMIRSLKNFRLIEKCDINAVAKILVKISSLSKKFSNISELDINPLIANDKEAVIVDARIVRQ